MTTLSHKKLICHSPNNKTIFKNKTGTKKGLFIEKQIENLGMNCFCLSFQERAYDAFASHINDILGHKRQTLTSIIFFNRTLLIIGLQNHYQLAKKTLFSIMSVSNISLLVKAVVPACETKIIETYRFNVTNLGHIRTSIKQSYSTICFCCQVKFTYFC